MKILGIESSCDETSAAIVDDGRKILSNVIATSMAMHEKTGGIIPEMAARQQVVSIIPVIKEALTGYDLEKDIDAIAITQGPGLIGSLLVGVETAKTMAMVLGKPIIPVNHVLAHLYANFLNTEKMPEFQALGLVVSGGHTELFLMNSPTSLKWIGGTLDDASGEAFDKSARILGLGFPGGPVISAKAKEFRNKKIKSDLRLPRPMIGDPGYNFSFSGLKTAVLREVQNLRNKNELTDDHIQNICYEIEEAITDVLVKKTLRAIEEFNIKSLLVGGGVAANGRLTEKFKQKAQGINIHIPPPALCTDNASYIACYAHYNNYPVDWKDVEARPDLDVEIGA